MRGGDHPGILASFRLSELTPDEIRDATGKLITEMRGKYDEVRGGQRLINTINTMRGETL